jgi:hypothetical protein
MKKIRCILILIFVLWTAPSGADEISIGFNLSEYPELVQVPDYPVYYAPSVSANYFFYDGDFWMYQDDNWYKSPWYDGPWERMDPQEVPDIMLQVPVRYYVQPPSYFFSWWYDEPPHWGEHWGHDWERHRHGWDKREHRLHATPAPLPEYQRPYTGEHYPRHRWRQHELQVNQYHYQAHDPFVQQYNQLHPVQSVPAQHNQNHMPGVAGLKKREGAVEQGTAPAFQQNVHSETQPQLHRPQSPPGTIPIEEKKHVNGVAESKRNERDTGYEQRRPQEKERNRER